jgi:hypothetical protein
VLGSGGRLGYLVQREPASGRLVPFDADSPDGQLLSRATEVPHLCDDKNCTGRVNYLSIELLYRIADLAVRHAGADAVHESGTEEVLRKKLEEAAGTRKLLDELCALLAPHGGESEGAVDVLKRIITSYGALRTAARTLVAQNVGDFVYQIRERETEGWEGPKVKAWGEACETLRREGGV